MRKAAPGAGIPFEEIVALAPGEQDATRNFYRIFLKLQRLADADKVRYEQVLQWLARLRTEVCVPLGGPHPVRF
jgi:hypothetical protein